MDPGGASPAAEGRGTGSNSSMSSFNCQLLTWGLVRSCDRVIQTVRLEGSYADRERFLSIISLGVATKDGVTEKNHGGTAGIASNRGGGDASSPNSVDSCEYFVLGIDRYYPSPATPKASANGQQLPEMITSIGLVSKLIWDVRISLDGDGGFSLRQLAKHFIFKPISVQSLWTIIQTLHMICDRMRPKKIPDASEDESWLASYPVTSPQSCINDWHAMADLLVRRPPSPERILDLKEKSSEELIKTSLRNIMKSVDLDSITSKGIRSQLELELRQNLENYKSFIDKEILVILGQMDPASRILDYLFLGSEWNASNLDELRHNGITHILNVTREIDNFFPAVFTYKNVREYDEESTDLLKYLDRTYKFIKGAKAGGGKVLVHCKMGISRSATVTISYVMKEHGMDLEAALALVKGRRSIVKPNKSFLKQLEVYEGILGAIRHRHTYFGLFRSKSESCLLPKEDEKDDDETEEIKPTSSRTAAVQIRVDIKALSTVFDTGRPNSEPISLRPKSWSPHEGLTEFLLSDEESGEEDCRCFGEFAQSCRGYQRHQDSNATVSSSLTLDLGRFAEARNHRLTVPGHKNYSPPIPPPPVNSPLYYNPNCPCDIEYELGVPEDPVRIHESTPFEEAESIVQRLSNLPLQVRTSGVQVAERSQKSMSYPISHPQKAARDDIDKNASDDDILRLQGDGGGGSMTRKSREELSVKTLASMFDFKIGSVPYRPCSARLEDSHLFKRAKKREIEERSGGSDC